MSSSTRSRLPRRSRAVPTPATESFATYVAAAELAHALGMGVNAGHDLDLENLRLFRTLPHLDEVSIGHALISRAFWIGLDKVVREYLDVLSVSATGTTGHDSVQAESETSEFRRTCRTCRTCRTEYDCWQRR